MMRIALTGGIASGKSTVTQLFITAGIPVIDCDAIVRENYRPGKPIYNAVLKTFGSTYLTDEGDIDKVKLGQLIFNDSQARETINTVTHPIVDQLVEEALSFYETEGHLFVVVDIPLLYETGSESKYDGVIVVYVEDRMQRKRLMARNDWTEEEAITRIQSQMSLEDKRHRAHWLIDNSGDLRALESEFVRVFKEIENSSKNLNKKVDSSR